MAKKQNDSGPKSPSETAAAKSLMNLALRKNAIKANIDAVTSLTESVVKLNAEDDRGNDIKEDLLKNLSKQKNASESIETIDKSIGQLLLIQVETNSDINSEMMKSLQNKKEVLLITKKLSDTEIKLKAIQSDIKTELLAQLGSAGKLVEQFKMGGMALLGWAILALVVKYLIDAVKRGIELNKTMGLNAKNAAVFEGNLQLARATIDGAKHGMDDLTKSANELVSATGQINLNPKLIADSTEISGLLGGDSKIGVSLARTLENAGHDSGKLTDEIKDMANELGMEAGPAMEMLAANQGILSRLTRDEIKARAMAGLEIKKMGLDVKKMNELAGEALDIESSMRSAMKLRIITGKDVNFNAMNSAKLAGDELGMAKELKKQIELLGGDYESNAQIQRIISEQTGLQKSEIQDILNSTKESIGLDLEKQKLNDELLKVKREQGLETLKEAQTFLDEEATNKRNLNLALGLVATLGSIYVLYRLITASSWAMAKLSKLGGNPIAKFVKGFGTSKVLMGAAAMLLVAASVAVLGYGMKQFMGLKWETMAKAGAAIVILTGLMFGLGALLMGGGAAIFGAGVVGFIALAGAMILLGIGLTYFGDGISSIAAGAKTLVPTLEALFDILSLKKLGLLMLLGPALMSVAAGLGAIGTIGLPGLLALTGLASVTVLLAPSLMGIADSIGDIFSNDSSDDSGNGDSALIKEIKALGNELVGMRSDIQSQPIMISVDGKVVSEIMRVANQQKTSKNVFGT